MNISRLMLSTALLCGVAASAEARQDPNPPPSGIVVHLFGPNSIMGNITSDLPGETAKPTTSKIARPGAAQPADMEAGNGLAAAGPAEAAPQADPYDPPVGAILHQMFVTGDPNDPVKPSTGRTADRPSAGN